MRKVEVGRRTDGEWFAVGDCRRLQTKRRNVLGLMPHPERASEALLGSADGFQLFKALRRARLEAHPG